MIINLEKIPCYWLTCSKSSNRWPKMQEMLQRLNLQDNKLEGRIVSPYTIGIAESHIEAISKSLDCGPTLILEDDARETDKFSPILSVPDDCDALYIGTSLYGRLNRQTQYGSALTADAGEYLRVFSMLSLHAVVYISNRYKLAIIENLSEFVKNPIGGCDDAIADKCQWRYNVMAVKSPFFAQNDGHSEIATLTSIHPFLY